MRLAAILAVLAGLLGAQSIDTPVNVLFPANNNLAPAAQDIIVAEDGRFAAVFGALPTVADVVIVDIGTNGVPISVNSILFPGNNDASTQNKTLVASRRGHFLCCYGSNGTVGDLVFIARNAGGAWVATNVLFPDSNDVPTVGTKPVISDDEEFIVCRGLSAIAEFVIVPVTFAGGVYSPGAAFNKSAPGGNTVPLSAVNPVIAPNSLSFAVATTNAAVGDLMIATVGKPVSAANTTVANVLFPGGNNVLSTLVPPVASPTSNAYVVYGQPATGDLVVVAMGSTGIPGAVTNVLFPAGNDLGYVSIPPPPPSISGNGRLVAVNGTDSVNGDLVLVPIDATGMPGPAANVPFGGGNNVPNLQLPPVVSSDGTLVLQRGSATIGDLVAVQVVFASPTSISGTTQNILYPANNNIPATGAHIALAPDRSYAVTLGAGTIGDIVITPFDGGGFAQTPINVLYPASNNVANLASTPRISREGNLVITSGTSTIGDMVVTGVAIDHATGLVHDTFTTNVLYPASNHNSPATREPVFSPTTQFAVSSGFSTIGDLVFVPLLDPFPRFLARAHVGTTVPVRIFSPTDAGKFVFVAAAAGRDEGIVLPDLRVVPLNDDLLLAFSLTIPNSVFTGFGTIVGPLDANGVFDGSAVILPPSVAFEGIWFYVGFVVLDGAAPLGIGTISRPSVFLVE
jgi:hypothetical protein